MMNKYAGSKCVRARIKLFINLYSHEYLALPDFLPKRRTTFMIILMQSGRKLERCALNIYLQLWTYFKLHIYKISNRKIFFYKQNVKTK